MQLCEVFDLVSRVRRRGRIRRLLRLLSRRLLLGGRLVVSLRFLIGLLSLVVDHRPSGDRSAHERPSPYPSPEPHREPLRFVGGDIRLSGWLTEVEVWVVRADNHPGDSLSSS